MTNIVKYAGQPRSPGHTIYSGRVIQELYNPNPDLEIKALNLPKNLRC